MRTFPNENHAHANRSQRSTGDVLNMNMNILRHPHAWSAALAIAAILMIGGGDLSAQVIVGNGKALFNGKDVIREFK